MGVHYRALWVSKQPTDVGQHIEELKQAIAAWAEESASPEPLKEGQTTLEVSQGRTRTLTARAAGAAAFDVTVIDVATGSATEWTTTIRLAVVDANVHVLVENGMDSDDVALRIALGRPRIVGDLLRMASKPVLGASALLDAPLSLPAVGVGLLTEILEDPNRTLPIIVCSEPDGANDGEWLETAKRIATRVEGVANVITLDHDAVSAFTDALGSLAIWNGGVRVYLPGARVTESATWRHRYYLGSRFEVARQSTIDRIVYTVAQLSTRRRVPDVFRPLVEQGGASGAGVNGMVSFAELESSREQHELEMMFAQDEQSEVEKELSRANGHLARLKTELLAKQLGDLVWSTQHEGDASMPDIVQDTSEAVLASRAYLADWLVLPESAARELEAIDTTSESFNWGNKTWRGLRALAAYVQDRANGWNGGGFWEWCATGPLLGWPATTKKLSMTESDTVQNSDKLRKLRLFVVDPEVDPSGETLMFAHLKISEGGGPLAPRVYFHDDTGGPTGKIHIGLVGPHSLVPNKSTN